MASSRRSSERTKNNVDLRKDGFLTPIRSQGKARCCSSFAGCGCVEYYINKKQNKKGSDAIVLSPQDIYSGLVKTKKEDKEGTTIEKVFEWMKTKGCVKEKSCRFRGTYLSSSKPRKVRFRINKYTWIPREKMEKYIDSRGPIVVTFLWLPGMANYSGGVYQGPADQGEFKIKKLSRHCLVVVGYGVEDVDGKKVKYWLLRNSHGVDWGEAGYGKFDQEIMHGRELLIPGGSAPEGISYRDSQDIPY